MFRQLLQLGIGLLVGLISAPGFARDLTIGLASAVTAIDPHFHFTGANMSMSRHFFDPLILQDEERRLRPGLAVSWRAIDPTTWEFRLRTGVKFHDGSDFTAEDVRYTLWRAINVPNNPGSFEVYIRNVKEAIVVDSHTIRLKTERPYPQLPADMSTFGIISHRIADFATTKDFASGKAMIGTGPLKFAEWVPGDRIVAVRNDSYWGERVAWDKVTFRYMNNNPTRVAALLSGQVDIIEQVPSTDIPTLGKREDVNLYRKTGNRLIHIQLDSHREKSPYITDKAGNPLASNPFKDARVRLAVSKAINRQAIVDRTLNGAGFPAGQVMPDGYYGTSPKVKPEAFDPEGAIRLLTEAGYPNGFAVVLHGPNDAYEQDEQVCMAVAQMLSRVGIAVKVETMPRGILGKRSAALDTSMHLAGFTSDTGEAASALRNLVSTHSIEKGRGIANRGRYSNPRFDQMLEDALMVLDDEKREDQIQKATEFVMADVPFVPLYLQVPSWGVRKGLAYAPRADGYMLAHRVMPAAR
ncbi:MAG TPA: ABC transporter substrate-binding protein [Alphaproteobacteria bacterium]|nr:ABC transporter substrate-binding protein [Alphaproteobacteria bacterium]